VANLATDLFHDAYRLVTEHIARPHERAELGIKMEIRPADRRRGHADDSVGRPLNGGV
jgi:hypothetical protein